MTLPSIPDNLYKFLVLGGIFCLAYSYIESIKSNDFYFGKVNSFNSAIDSIDLEMFKNRYEIKQLKNKADFISNRYHIKNPIVEKDSLLLFNQALSGDKAEMLVTDSLLILWNHLKENQFKIELLTKHIAIQQNNLHEAKAEYLADEELNNFIMIFGSVLLFFGLIGMMWLQIIQDELLKRQLQDKPKVFKYCQSCGKKFSSMIVHGTKSDGSVHTAFCSVCYSEGRFKEPELSKKDFTHRGDIEIAKMKSFLRKKILLKRFKRLERWRDNDYF